MILLFSCNEEGGVLQLCIQLLKEFIAAGYICESMIPEGAKVTIPNRLKPFVNHYSKVKSLLPFDKRIKEIANKIIALNPDFVFYVDSSLLTCQVCSSIGNRLAQLVTVHDTTDHPTNYSSLKGKLHSIVVEVYRKKAYSTATKIVLLSPDSQKKYISMYPNRDTIQINLGAHVPEVEPRKPQENISYPYLLFFGRIDKYKGIANMLNAFKDVEEQIPLVIAGKGILTEEEQQLIKNDNRVLLINRYIEDDEMIWLFQHSLGVLLPYIEASQSGIIPIAYKYGIPVVVSNVDGLKQFVKDRETGYVCKTKNEYVNAIIDIIKNQKMLTSNCKSFYMEYLDWQKSIKTIVNEIRNKNMRQS